MKKKTVKIIIPAYNAHDRIQDLLKSLASQKLNKKHEVKIYVYSDHSSDKTVTEAKKTKSTVLTIIEGKKRLGFAGVVKKFIQENKSDILIFLNDDIVIKDNNFINSIVEEFLKTQNLGFSCIDIKPLSTKTFIEKANYSSFKAYREMAYSYRNGANIFTCDGKVMILSKKFTNSLSLPENSKKMGNVDCFLYFECLRLKLSYACFKTITAYFAFPSTISDYIKWTGRNNSNIVLLEETFGNVVSKEYTKPKSVRPYFIKETIKNPFGSLFILALRFWVNRKSKKLARNFNVTWDTINTTKVLTNR